MSKLDHNKPIYHVCMGYHWREESNLSWVGDSCLSNSLWNAMVSCYQSVITTPTWDFNEEYILFVSILGNPMQEISLSTGDNLQPIEL